MVSTTCEVKTRVFMGKIVVVIVMFVQIIPPHLYARLVALHSKV
jgi:hypothetical protein